MFLIFFWIERDYKYIQIHIKHKIYDKFSLKLLNGQLGYFGFFKPLFFDKSERYFVWMMRKVMSTICTTSYSYSLINLHKIS